MGPPPAWTRDSRPRRWTVEVHVLGGASTNSFSMPTMNCRASMESTPCRCRTRRHPRHFLRLEVELHDLDQGPTRRCVTSFRRAIRAFISAS